MVSNLVLEAIELVDRASKKIEEGVLSRSKDLRQEALSLVYRVYDLCSTLHKFFDQVGKIVVEDKDKAVYPLRSRSFIVVSSGELVYVKTKPTSLVVSYRSSEKKVNVKTKRFSLSISRDKLEASHYNLKLELDIGSPKDYVEKYNELRYILNKVQKIVSTNISIVLHSKA